MIREYGRGVVLRIGQHAETGIGERVFEASERDGAGIAGNHIELQTGDRRGGIGIGPRDRDAKRIIGSAESSINRDDHRLIRFHDRQDLVRRHNGEHLNNS